MWANIRPLFWCSLNIIQLSRCGILIVRSGTVDTLARRTCLLSVGVPVVPVRASGVSAWHEGVNQLKGMLLQLNWMTLPDWKSSASGFARPAPADRAGHSGS